ncbi:hypothetical protein F2Q70_00036176 [Brassica cretica]|uniref:Uncharacterized protein n=1 Tax=Brassica cretica TaxID=69181 RepID=A0A8S9K2D5_BRACR|nr:hypothetical protein F2Q70_00036176 [Brassica cretica]
MFRWEEPNQKNTMYRFGLSRHDLKPRLVELRRRSVTAGFVGDHIFSDCQKMDLPALPQRIYTLGEETPTHKSISYHTGDSNLFNALRGALNADE